LTERPKTKDELLQRIDRAYTALEETIGQLSDEQMVAPIDDSWSAKDLLAHVTAWEQLMLHFHIGGRPFSEIAQIDSVTYGNSSIDEINAAFYQRDKDRPLQEVLDAFRRSHEQLLMTLGQMSEAELYKSYTPAGRGPDSAGQLIDWVVGDSYEHYEEHRATIQTWAEQSR
jgi:hypothetical protein